MLVNLLIYPYAESSTRLQCIQKIWTKFKLTDNCSRATHWVKRRRSKIYPSLVPFSCYPSFYHFILKWFPFQPHVLFGENFISNSPISLPFRSHPMCIHFISNPFRIHFESISNPFIDTNRCKQ